MLYNIEPVNEMLDELRKVERQIECLNEVIKKYRDNEIMRKVTAVALSSRRRRLKTIAWILEEEFEHGCNINSILDDNDIQNIQRVVN